jgi:alpha-tubulin suppressor-like RCC1 family protein
MVGSDTNWSQLAFGYYHTIALKTDGTLWSWGANERGQLGENDRVYRSSPVQVGTDTNWYDIASEGSGIQPTSFAIARN